MIRVLHIHGCDIDLPTTASLRALGAHSEDIRTIGRGGDFGNVVWAVLGLRRLINSYDVFHAWDARSLAAATYAGATRVAFTLPAEISPRGSWQRHGATVVCTTPTQQRFSGQTRLIRPPLPALQSRTAMRHELGLRDDDFVMLAPGESTRNAAHERAVWAGSILHVTDERYRVLLWGRGPRLRIATGLGDKLRQKRLVVAAQDRPFEALLSAADIVLVSPTGPVSTLPIAMAMSAGVPVIAAERPEYAELLTDGVTAMTVPSCTPRLIAQRILDLRAAAGLAERLAEKAKERAQQLFTSEQFADQYEHVYLEAAGHARLAASAAALGIG